jgi:spore coat protein U-like protein
MRSFKSLPAVAAGVLLAMAGGAQAATTTASFTVTANVAANCLVTTTNMDFGTFNGVADRTATADINVRCTDDVGYTVALDVGTGGGVIATGRLLDGPGANTLTYNLYSDPAHSNIWGTALADRVAGTGTGLAVGDIFTHVVHGLLPGAGNEAAQVGAYTSTIGVTVEY